MNNGNTLSAIEYLNNALLNKENVLSILGGVIFVSIFIFRYSFIDTNWYDYRDDGVITMSSAKNLIDFGFIGVSVSGPIVEVSSCPVQFFTYAAAYLFTGINYIDFTYWQTIISTFIIGFIFIRFFTNKPAIALLITSISAFGLSYFYPFFEWHASGMENAITHALFLGTIYILYISVQNEHINYWLTIVVFLAAISRIDSVYHISILLAAFSIYWLIAYKNLKAFYFSLITFSMWFLFQCWRYYYFGDLLPNTAHAQSISMANRILSVLHGDVSTIKKNLDMGISIFNRQAGLLIFAFFALIYLLKYINIRIAINLEKNYKFVLLLILLIIISSSLNPFLFGKTRIDIARTTTQMTLLVFLFLAIAAYSFCISDKSNKDALLHNFKSFGLMLLSIFTLFMVSKYYLTHNKPYYLGWSTNGFNNVRNKLINIAKFNDIERPTISNSDLGAMTWHKQLNVVDLGKIGSPIMAKLENGPMMTEYYLNYALPDLIEAHGYFIRKYCSSIFTQEKFNQLYSVVGRRFDMNSVCSDRELNLPIVYWIRKDIKIDSDSAERNLLNDLQNNLAETRIKNEIDSCDSHAEDCSYIARTVYKFIPELRNSSQFDSVYSLFFSETDKALLRGWKDGQAHEVIISALKTNGSSEKLVGKKTVKPG